MEPAQAVVAAVSLFHHDSRPSGGKTWLRSLKVAELEYLPDGSIKTIEAER